MGGDWIDQRQEQQQAILHKAYEPKAEVAHATVEVPEPDAFDQAYVFLRTFVPGWLMGTFILIGAVTMAVVTFKRQIKNLIIIWGDLLKGGSK